MYVPLTTNLPPLYRFGAVAPTVDDYDLLDNDNVVYYTDPAVGFTKRQKPKRGISLFSPIEPAPSGQGIPVSVSSDQRCFMLDESVLPDAWRIVRLGSIQLLLDNGSPITMDHYYLYACASMSVDAFVNGPKVFSWLPCPTIPGAGAMILATSRASEHDQADDLCIYALQMMQYLWRNDNLTMNQRVLVCHLHDTIATKKKPLLFLGQAVLLPLYNILASADYNNNASMLFRHEQVASTIRNILIEVHSRLFSTTLRHFLPACLYPIRRKVTWSAR
jgi:hypothetical protein